VAPWEATEQMKVFMAKTSLSFALAVIVILVWAAAVNSLLY
jgi:hypothetical protein